MRLQPAGPGEAEADDDGGAAGGAEAEDGDGEGGIGSLRVEASVLVAASCAVGARASRRSASTSDMANRHEGVRRIGRAAAVQQSAPARRVCRAGVARSLGGEGLADSKYISPMTCVHIGGALAECT